MKLSYILTRIHPEDGRSMEQLHRLLEQEGISLDANLDYTCGLFDENLQLIATGSTFGATLRCFAVERAHQGEGLLNQIVSHLIERQAERGITHLFVYTKCRSAPFFSDLGFYEIARVDDALSFLENRRRGFAKYCESLAKGRREGLSAAIVMNANPFTLGHRYLVERAARECDFVHLFVLSEDAGPIPFSARWGMVTEGVSDLRNVLCHASGPYIISKETFPSYFLKDDETVIRSHALLDLELFRAIAGALGIGVRYVGREPYSQVTGIYNQVMEKRLPQIGVQCAVVPRKTAGDTPISASAVRQAIHDGRLDDIKSQVPQSTWDYFHTPAAETVIAAIKGCRDVIHY